MFASLKAQVSLIRDLLSRSGNRCAFPGCERALVSADGQFDGGVSRFSTDVAIDPVADSASGGSAKPGKFVMLLLCATHHAQVSLDADAHLSTWLRKAKGEHESERSDHVVEAWATELSAEWLQEVAEAHLVSVVIFHGQADRPFAEWLRSMLELRGVVSSLEQPPSHQARSASRGALRRVLLCCSKNTRGAWWIQEQLSHALDLEERQDRGKQLVLSCLIPIDLDGSLQADGIGSGWTAELAAREPHSFAVSGGDFANELNRLAQCIRSRRNPTASRDPAAEIPGLALRYRSGSDRLAADVLAPCLDRARYYDRACGFFSSSVFAVAPDEFERFFARGGIQRLVCSPVLSQSDAEAFRSATAEGHRWRSGQGPPVDWARLVAEHRGTSQLLAWLVANRRIRVQIAIVSNDDLAIYHEKIAVFRRDSRNGPFVSLSGSANESALAYERNFERIEVFASTGPSSEASRAHQVQSDFEVLWQGDAGSIELHDLHEAVESGLLVVRGGSSDSNFEPSPTDSAPMSTPTESKSIRIPSTIELFQHQDAAIRAWGNAGGRGILAMATGSGKTVTALALAARVADRTDGRLAVLVIAPFLNLIDQWRREASRFGLDLLPCAVDRKHWFDRLRSSVTSYNSGTRRVLGIATTGNTLRSALLQEQLARIRGPLLVIADEMHNYGTEAAIESLPTSAKLRLGLSATWQRWRDDDGTDRLRGYFGDEVFSYGLEDALQDEVLTPYHYYPELIEFTADETQEYAELTGRIGRLQGGRGDEPSEAAKRLLIQRARVVAAASAKTERLCELLSTRREETHILVYCGDGRVLDSDGERLTRQVADVQRMIGRELGMRCATYTYDNSHQERRRLLEQFDRGHLQVLIAIRCLDEGVDVPDARQAYLLASTTNPKQYVQRRGRVLRRAPGKTRADVFDFFVVPPPRSVVGIKESVFAGLAASQLDRVSDFAELASNGPVAMRRLIPIRDRFGLL